MPEPGDATLIAPESPTTASAGEPHAEAAPAAGTPSPPAPRARAEVGRAAAAAVRALGRAVASAARLGAGAARGLWRLLDTVPAAVRGAALVAVVALVGVVGALALHNTVGLLCTVVVIPVASSVLGALLHRWYSRAGTVAPPRTSTDSIEPSASDLQRSVEYVDHKLGIALTSLGTDRHQQAVVALFQAKTAVELTLGTERESPSYDLEFRADDYGLSPRVTAGSKATSTLRESNSLAAS